MKGPLQVLGNSLIDVVPLRGGFGNQLFCWAYGKALAAAGGRVFYDRGSSLGRGYALEGLIDPWRTVVLHGGVWRRIDSLERGLKRLPLASILKEDQTRPPSEALKRSSSIGGAATLHWGYWQSHDYFDRVSEVVADELSSWLDCPLQPPTSSCAIHVRRGDYVADSGAAQTLGAQSLDYYHSAITIMREHGYTSFTVHTDDRKWVAENLEGPDVSISTASSALEDFISLSKASAIVMSNSSFSWWAAFLASRRGAHVIGPQRWFNDDSFDDSRIMMDGWKRV